MRTTSLDPANKSIILFGDLAGRVELGVVPATLQHHVSWLIITRQYVWHAAADLGNHGARVGKTGGVGP